MSEIGTILNLSESRVSQIHKELIQRLRTRSGIRLAEELAG
jgi:DNA-directed RNA polymerase specialized sigma subunit